MGVISIHQPNYIPWLGYFYKIFSSDIFVFLDDAQYSNEGMHNYHYIKTPQGPFRLKIPVKGSFGEPINSVITNDALFWKEKHLKTILSNYRRANYFEIIYIDFESLISKNYTNLAEMNEEIIKFVSRKFGFNTNFVNSSSLGIVAKQEERIIQICEKLNGDVYFSGKGAMHYQDEIHFRERGIKLEYSDFKPFKYPQLWNGFQENVTILDYLMNCGYNWDRVIECQRIC
jgi:hypothetical protein